MLCSLLMPDKASLTVDFLMGNSTSNHSEG